MTRRIYHDIKYRSCIARIGLPADRMEETPIEKEGSGVLCSITGKDGKKVSTGSWESLCRHFAASAHAAHQVDEETGNTLGTEAWKKEAKNLDVTVEFIDTIPGPYPAMDLEMLESTEHPLDKRYREEVEERQRQDEEERQRLKRLREEAERNEKSSRSIYMKDDPEEKRSPPPPRTPPSPDKEDVMRDTRGQTIRLYDTVVPTLPVDVRGRLASYEEQRVEKIRENKSASSALKWTCKARGKTTSGSYKPWQVMRVVQNKDNVVGVTFTLVNQQREVYVRPGMVVQDFSNEWWVVFGIIPGRNADQPLGAVAPTLRLVRRTPGQRSTQTKSMSVKAVKHVGVAGAIV